MKKDIRDVIKDIAACIAAGFNEEVTDMHLAAARQALEYRRAVIEGKHPVKVTALSGAELKYGRPATERDAETTARWLYDAGFSVKIWKNEFYISRVHKE